MNEHFLPYALEWETSGTVPEHVWGVFNRHVSLFFFLRKAGYGMEDGRKEVVFGGVA